MLFFIGSGHRKGHFQGTGIGFCLVAFSGKRSDSSHDASDAGIGFAFTISQLVAVNL